MLRDALCLGLILGGLSGSVAFGQNYRYTQILPPATGTQPIPITQPATPAPAAATPAPSMLTTTSPAPASPQAQQSLQEILDRLHRSNKLPDELRPTIEMTQSDVLNAATNGERIMMTSALWNQLGGNDQRAFVVSHELAHVILNHVTRTQTRRIGLGLLDRFILRRYIAEGTLVGMAKDLGLNLYDLRSGRHYEYQADDLGIQLMATAGYNPKAALDVFQVLQQASPGDKTPEFLRSHPITESRIRALVQKHQITP